MAKYLFNTQNHMRIWFSGNPDVFLNDENQLRLVQFRQKNPRANMTFLYSSSMLSANTVEDLRVFCEKQNFTPLDFDTDLLAECCEQTDIELHQIAKTELDAYVTQQGGNLAAASDITRLITPLLARGTYSDFDTNITVESLPDIMEVDGPVLLDIGSVRQLIMGIIPSEVPLINNDIIGVSMQDGEFNPVAKELINYLQQKVITAYRQDVLTTFSQLSDNPLMASSMLTQYFKLKFFDELFKQVPHMSVTDFRLSLDKSTRNIFSSFRLMRSEDRAALTQGLDEALDRKMQIALENMSNEDFPDEILPEEQAVIRETYLRNLKSSLQQSVTALLAISPQQAEALNVQYSLIKNNDNPEECYQLLQSQASGLRASLLIGSVTLFSGPMQLAVAVQDLSFLEVSDDERASISFKELSFDRSHLFENFNSGQSFRLGTSAEVVQSSMTAEKTGTVCDLSWIPQGKEFIHKREEKLHAAAQTIQKKWGGVLNAIKDSDDNEDNTLDSSSMNNI
ncbi:MAG: glycosyltransferase family 88 protein [Legionellaceae bacterium]|nr:glycosyltransferase family 88 protein [Legionellaceae bacterium]